MGKPCEPYRWGTNHSISFTSTSTAQSTAIATGVYAVRLFPTTACHVKVGTSPTAATTDPRLEALTETYMTIYPGEKVAAIRTTTSGTLHVTEVS